MKSVLTIIFIFLFACTSATSFAYVIDHNSTDITQIPESAINTAKTNLHIAYGHTSHGSQLTTGMTGLVAFANGGGLGLALPHDIFEYNNGGTGGALDLHDSAMGGDCGYYPQWVDNTRDYLASHSDTNVIIWSWCGQVSGISEQDMIDEYLAPMTQLELDYPAVTFVYMTGHSDGSGETGNLHLRNQQIRDYCITHDKVLFDFYDIEIYDPDNNYYGDKRVDDGCNYDSDNNGSRDANWATEWQDSHTEDVDWYDCSSAHSQPLNANRKAYAAWWLWARIAGWGGGSGADTAAPTIPQNLTATIISATQTDLSWDASSDNTAVTGYKIFRNGTEIANSADPTYQDTHLSSSETYTYRVSAYDAAGNESQLSDGAGNRWIPELIAPDNGATDVLITPTVNFQWVDDAARMNVTYTLYYSTDPELSALFIPLGKGIPFLPQSGTVPAVITLLTLLFFLIWLAKKTTIPYKYIVLYLGITVALAACGSGGGSSSGGSSHNPTVYSVDKGTSDHHEASDLDAGTTYYWRVIATDTTDSSVTYTSDTHHFTTEN